MKTPGHDDLRGTFCPFTEWIIPTLVHSSRKWKKEDPFPVSVVRLGWRFYSHCARAVQKGWQQTSLVLGRHGAPAQSGDSYRLSCLEILDYPDLLFGLNGENKSLFGVGARKTRMLGLMTTCARKLDEFRSDFDQCAVMPYKFVQHLSLLQRRRQLKAAISHPSVGKTYKVWQCQALVIKWSSTLAAVYRGGDTLETNL